MKQKLYPFGTKSDSLGGYGTYDEPHIARAEAFYLAASHRQIKKSVFLCPLHLYVENPILDKNEAKKSRKLNHCEEPMKEKNCYRCGKGLQPGSLFYVVYIRVVSGFDGILSEPAEEIDEQLKSLFEEVRQLDPKELEKDVYEEITVIMCKSCRDRFVDEVQHPWEGPFQIRTDPDSLLH